MNYVLRHVVETAAYCDCNLSRLKQRGFYLAKNCDGNGASDSTGDFADDRYLLQDVIIRGCRRPRAEINRSSLAIIIILAVIFMRLMSSCGVDGLK